MDFILSTQFLSLILIPVCAAIIGWFTNWMAVKMTFFPVEFFGAPPYLGWQGIIPRNSKRIGQKTVDLVTNRLVPAEEVLARVDPDRLAEELQPVFDSVCEEIAETVVKEQSPRLWALMPRVLKEQIFKQVRDAIPELFDRLLTEYRENMDELFDLRGLVLHNLTGENKQLLNELFMRAGREEFKFIVRCGLYFGFVLGCVQAVAWYFVQGWWMLPLAGVLVGYITNWLAIQMIFRPLKEKRFLFVRYQGLFLKRQDEVSEEYAALLADKVIIPSKIIDTLVRGKRAGLFIDVVQRQIEVVLQGKLGKIGKFKGVVLYTFGTERYDQLKQRVTRKFIELVPRHINRMEDYWRDAMDLRQTISGRLRALPAAEFEDVLRTCFRQDEKILIAVGAVLGMVAGALEAAAILAL